MAVPLGDHMPSSAVVCTGAFGICVANGHNSEAAEVMRSLFSWAEFMAEEPVERQNRRGKQEASSLSLFEWALSLEEEREEERVGGEALTRTTQGDHCYVGSGPPVHPYMRPFFVSRVH